MRRGGGKKKKHAGMEGYLAGWGTRSVVSQSKDEAQKEQIS